MKHITIIQDKDDIILLKTKVNEWINSNKLNILEIVDIEYSNTDTMYMATITYMEK
ncbi:hypothetical protein [Senegalia massiliensis]|uniref:hypothetical protein n=1 Tax=Senegalia massiliensis TaxID=1720316 RepID=UPI0013EF3F47|nr:hypothetical protein [Senegalia massiliensis]